MHVRCVRVERPSHPPILYLIVCPVLFLQPSPVKAAPPHSERQAADDILQVGADASSLQWLGVASDCAESLRLAQLLGLRPPALSSWHVEGVGSSTCVKRCGTC